MNRKMAILLTLSAWPAAAESRIQVLSAGEKIAGVARLDASRAHRVAARFNSIVRSNSTVTPRLAVFTGDAVIPQVVDGGGWQTTMTFVNLRPTTNTFALWLFTDSGGDMFVDIAGVGRTDAVSITLPPNESITLETLGTAGNLNQGWAYLFTDQISIEVGSVSIFRQRVAGRPDFEATVPTVSEFDRRFLLVFDNTRGFATAAAIANSDTSAISVEATVRDEDNNILTRETFSIARLSKVAFTLPSRWAQTANRRGVVEFRATGFGASGLGLRFNPGGAFTSVHTLAHVDW